MEKTYKFKSQVDDIFYDVTGYYEDEKHRQVGFNVTSGFSAEKLFKLSDLLGTASIYSSPEAYESGGCPTCGSDITKYIEISASEVKF